MHRKEAWDPMTKEAGDALGPRVIPLHTGRTDYLPILKGPPDSITMRSGLVTLDLGKSVGLHSTENFEELLIVFEGQGEVRISGRDSLTISAGYAAYCPPETEHNVVNTGSTPLRYIYVVAEAARG